MSGKGVLLDTSVIIDFLRQKDNKNTWFFKLAEREDKLSTSILVHTELYSGKKVWSNVRARKELNDLLSFVDILPMSQSISKLGGKIRSGIEIELVDAIIAATAIENKLSLATMNQKHFKGIKGLKLLGK